MIGGVDDITFAACRARSPSKVEPICTTTNDPDNNPFGYT